jgi:hypothetical protein
MSVSQLDIESGDSATTPNHFVTWMLQLKFHMDDDNDSVRSLRDSKLECLEKANSSIRSWQQEGRKLVPTSAWHGVATAYTKKYSSTCRSPLSSPIS